MCLLWVNVWWVSKCKHLYLQGGTWSPVVDRKLPLCSGPQRPSHQPQCRLKHQYQADERKKLTQQFLQSTNIVYFDITRVQEYNLSGFCQIVRTIWKKLEMVFWNRLLSFHSGGQATLCCIQRSNLRATRKVSFSRITGIRPNTLSYHFILFAVKTNGAPLSCSAELKFYLAIITILIPHGFHGHEIPAVTTGRTALGLKVATLCFTASIFINLQQ